MGTPHTSANLNAHWSVVCQYQNVPNHICLLYLSTAEACVWFQWNFVRYFNRNISANQCCYFTGDKNKLLYLQYWLCIEL